MAVAFGDQGFQPLDRGAIERGEPGGRRMPGCAGGRWNLDALPLQFVQQALHHAVRNRYGIPRYVGIHGRWS
ncbi:hypothetical protein D3C72_2047060 [compost metagenome]